MLPFECIGRTKRVWRGSSRASRSLGSDEDPEERQSEGRGMGFRGFGVLGGLGFRGLGVRGLGALGFRGLGGYIYGFG